MNTSLKMNLHFNKMLSKLTSKKFKFYLHYRSLQRKFRVKKNNIEISDIKEIFDSYKKSILKKDIYKKQAENFIRNINYEYIKQYSKEIKKKYSITKKYDLTTATRINLTFQYLDDLIIGMYKNINIYEIHKYVYILFNKFIIKKQVLRIILK